MPADNHIRELISTPPQVHLIIKTASRAERLDRSRRLREELRNSTSELPVLAAWWLVFIVGLHHGETLLLSFFGWDPTLFQSAFEVNAGDIVYAEVGAPPNGNQPSYLFLEDLTTLSYESFSVQLPYGETFIGNTAEWIVERHCCRNDGYPYPLLNTIDTFFDGGAALDYAGNTLYPGSQATTTQVLTMRDDGNDENIEFIYQGSSGYEGQHGLLLQRTGCAYTGGCAEK